jgi:hypothetical protein
MGDAGRSATHHFHAGGEGNAGLRPLRVVAFTARSDLLSDVRPPIRVVFSYSHADDQHRIRLEKAQNHPPLFTTAVPACALPAIGSLL